MSLILHPDGTASIVYADGVPPVVLRRPTIGEWREIVVRAEQADIKAVGMTKAGVALYEDPIYARLLLHVMTTLGVSGVPAPSFTADDMPMWAATGAAIGDLAEHWRTVPLAHGAP